MNPNIAALQAAENLLRDHDSKIKEVVNELKGLKKTRPTMVARVQECIDVLCGRGTPSLFAEPVAESGASDLVIFQCPRCLVFSRNHSGRCECGTPPAETGPLVCAEVGSAKLADIEGVTAQDAERMAYVGLKTLADLQTECGDDLTNAPGLLESWVEEFTAGDADRVAKAVERHLNPALVLPTAPPTGVQYPPKDDWRTQGLAIMGLNEKLLKACKRSDVFTVGELHDWIDEDFREDGGFFGEGVLWQWIKTQAKLAEKFAKANAEILYQFFADKGFLGVPDKEGV